MPAAAIAIGIDAHLPGAGGHQPERAGEKLRIFLGWLGKIGNGRELRLAW